MNTNPEAKRILCLGDSNTWGWVPGKMGTERFAIDVRWPGVLQKLLGDGYEVIEEALGARTISTDDPRPELPLRNALQTLPIILESHLPLDLVVIMLGTTETKEMMNLSAQEIGQKMHELILCIKNFRTLDDSASPEVLILVPPIVDERAEFASTLFRGATKKCKELASIYRELAKLQGCLFFDTSSVAIVGEDGVHITEQGHKAIAEGIVEILTRL